MQFEPANEWGFTMSPHQYTDINSQAARPMKRGINKQVCKHQPKPGTCYDSGKEEQALFCGDLASEVTRQEMAQPQLWLPNCIPAIVFHV